MGVVYIEFLLVASMLGFCLSCNQGFSLNCSLFRARLCWGGGGSVAFEGCAGGVYALYPNVMLLV